MSSYAEYFPQKEQAVDNKKKETKQSNTTQHNTTTTTMNVKPQVSITTVYIYENEKGK